MTAEVVTPKFYLVTVTAVVFLTVKRILQQAVT